MITPLAKLRNKILKNKLDAVLISSHSNIIYLTNYSGFSKEEREAYLLITKDKQYILTDGRYTHAVKKLIPDFKLIEISGKLSVIDILKNLKTKHKIKKIGFEGHDLTHLEHERLSKELKIYHVNLDSLRSVKTSEEISLIEKACNLGDKAFDYILKKIKLGISEKELAFEIEFFIKRAGGDISFKPIVAFGKNSATPHHQTSNQRLTTKDKFVLLDFGVKLNNYCSDMSRTVFFGSTNAELKKIYQTVLAAQQKAIQQFSNLTIKQLEEGVKASEIDKIAREYIISKGYPTIPHSVGHGIGIDVHEAPHLSPKSKDILKDGMVFSIEPGNYISNFGGIRIEDLVVWENNKIRLLTKSSSKLTIL